MSEYSFVEKPFLDQLDKLGWVIVDQGVGVPQDPAGSLRMDFQEIVLKDVFKERVSRINTMPDGSPWLTDKQLDDLFDELTHHPAKSLLEANEDVLKLEWQCRTALLLVFRYIRAG